MYEANEGRPPQVIDSVCLSTTASLAPLSFAIVDLVCLSAATLFYIAGLNADPDPGQEQVGLIMKMSSRVIILVLLRIMI